MIVTPLEGLSSPTLAERYRKGDPDVCKLFGSHPSHSRHWRDRAEYLDREAAGRANRKRLAEALRAYHDRLPAGEEARRSIDRLEREDSLVVVGGQQAGLFGGPLMILHKALTVVQTARYAESLLGRPVVPVFWIAGEDHDFEEANHVHVSSLDGADVKKVKMDRPAGPRRSVSRTGLTAEQWTAAIEELSASLPDTEFKPKLLDRIRSYAEDAPTLTVSFARLMAEWFGPEGLVLLDSDDPGIRALEGEFFRKLIERNEELESRLREGEALVRELGFPLQAESAEGCANLFLHHDAGRLLLFRKDGRYIDRKEEAALSEEELLRLADRSPEALSNNALTRPLMQDYVLPVLATVLGHAEIAYWSGLGPAFRMFGMAMPIVVPRQSFTFLEAGVSSLLEKYGATVEQIISDGERLKAEWLESQDDWRLEERFREARERFLELYAPVLDTVAAMQPGLAKLGEGNRDRILEQIAYLENRAVDALAKKHEASLRQWDRMRCSLWPQGKPQERVLGIVHYLNRYGPDWLRLWREVPYDAAGGHRLVAP
ncbi:putative cysteine ligase BshC [Cohnella xylanilytica]|uniref:Putative cysteine ligase BshC n=1 Tax=Cohnella xylanilytica TaxID=557555 RepID=A0A841U3W5_9BACL|nr:bacillithiol biosynthesis cysteine-adding enzyme BshC [Cohnella xylanilytica]MBB6695417.1 bacillithiol biosynthesis cysteine-adding enzyme BshC [Cohnella xylanilytica]GIO13324.1 putative cysteine ligase BshC [Cohnella xylanilytica]